MSSPQHVPPPPPLPVAPPRPSPSIGARLAALATIVAFLAILLLALWYGARLAQRAACDAGQPCAPVSLYLRTAGNLGGTFGVVALFVGFLAFTGTARLLYLGLWLSIFCAWLIGITLLGGVPLLLQLGVPAFALWGVVRVVKRVA